MSKIILEFADGPHKWRQINVNLCFSQKANYYIKHGNDVYVFKDLKEGTRVEKQTNGTWEIAGRITRNGTVFIGGPDEKRQHRS